MITVGIDVSKGKSTVAAMRPGGEIGDVRRFHNKQALVAYASVDAPPYQSGNFTSKHRHITKRGSKNLRRVVFQVAR